MSEPILKAVREKGYDELTPIQQRAIPIVLRGADILGIAQTGTGKTAAFALPLLQRLIEERSLEREPSAVAGETVPLRRERRGRSHGKSGRRAIRSLVLTPTREARPSDRRVVRRLRKVYGPEARDDFRGSQAGTSDGQAPPGHRYSDRHSRTSARPDRSGRGPDFGNLLRISCWTRRTGCSTWALSPISGACCRCFRSGARRFLSRPPCPGISWLCRAPSCAIRYGSR